MPPLPRRYTFEEAVYRAAKPGCGAPLAALIRDGYPKTDAERELLARFVEGEKLVRRKRGRPPASAPFKMSSQVAAVAFGIWQERRAYYAQQRGELDAGLIGKPPPLKRQIRAAAARTGLSEGEIHNAYKRIRPGPDRADFDADGALIIK